MTYEAIRFLLRGWEPVTNVAYADPHGDIECTFPDGKREFVRHGKWREVPDTQRQLNSDE